MTKVIARRRPVLGDIQLASAADAMRFRLGDLVVLDAKPPGTLLRAWRWFARKVLRVRPARPVALVVSKVDHATGVVTLEVRP